MMRCLLFVVRRSLLCVVCCVCCLLCWLSRVVCNLLCVVGCGCAVCVVCCVLLSVDRCVLLVGRLLLLLLRWCWLLCVACCLSFDVVWCWSSFGD